MIEFYRILPIFITSGGTLPLLPDFYGASLRIQQGSLPIDGRLKHDKITRFYYSCPHFMGIYRKSIHFYNIFTVPFPYRVYRFMNR